MKKKKRSTSSNSVVFREEIEAAKCKPSGKELWILLIKLEGATPFMFDTLVRPLEINIALLNYI